MAIPAGDRDLIGFEVVQGVRQSLDGLEGHLHDAGGEGIFPFPGRGPQLSRARPSAPSGRLTDGREGNRRSVRP